MSDEIKALVERVSHLLPVVVNMTQDYAELSFGDAHPTQAMTMQPDDWLALNDIATALTAQADEIERLNAIVKRVQGAAKTIMHHEGDELARLRKQAQEHHFAIRTLDSEREANALLTVENEHLRTTLQSIHSRAYPKPDRTLGECADELMYIDDLSRAALKAAQEVKA